ncbi:MAG: hypothetical protein KF745_04320 [Phycisphaeraceae bacterium]|nr:hypothetical protein [Phycisphaeraceae bacterium]
MRRDRYLNGVLTVIAALLATNLLVKFGDSNSPAAAVAQQPVLSPPFNSGQERQEIYGAIERLGQKLDAFENSLAARLEKGLNVKVLSMPPVVISGDKRDEKSSGPNSDTKIEVKRSN